MRHIAFCLLVAGILAGCESGADPAPGDSAPVTSASFEADEGTCRRCNAAVFEGHRCGRTMPCATCAREAGPQHRHSLVWGCVPCNRTYTATHICTHARTCPTCRTDGTRRMPPRGCDGCGGILTAYDTRPATTYCAECSIEAGPGHLHGKTQYCGTCEREAGEYHVHNATKMCAECAHETAPDHRHGITAYCRACGLDQGMDHEHGRTVWCLKCQAEKPFPHGVHTSAQ